ncbi:hypothetical protein T190130A13A_100086 [Tenacibaculum sp. 190130A14a]|uniref:50S ribosomal protein L34 n=1 Tax=Tenacibaculum polynesiense TaxID=3137857 RepID=A0ABM9P6I8_9FLAO
MLQPKLVKNTNLKYYETKHFKPKRGKRIIKRRFKKRTRWSYCRLE